MIGRRMFVDCAGVVVVDGRGAVLLSVDGARAGWAGGLVGMTSMGRRNFLLRRHFRFVSSVLTQYSRSLRPMLSTQPVIVHRLVAGSWMRTRCPGNSRGSSRFRCWPWRSCCISRTWRRRLSISNLSCGLSECRANGMLSRMSRPKSSWAGDRPVGARGVFRNISMAAARSDLFSVEVVWLNVAEMIFFISRTVSSANPFDWGWCGLDLMCSIPQALQKSSNTPSSKNCGPPSE